MQPTPALCWTTWPTAALLTFTAPLCRAAGATAVLLTPVVASAEGRGPMGRAPVSFFAPEPSMANGDSPNAAAQELKQMIRGLHEEGIEVLLQARRAAFLPCLQPISNQQHAYL